MFNKALLLSKRDNLTITVVYGFGDLGWIAFNNHTLANFSYNGTSQPSSLVLTYDYLNTIGDVGTDQFRGYFDGLSGGVIAPGEPDPLEDVNVSKTYERVGTSTYMYATIIDVSKSSVLIVRR